ncbi:maturation protein [ssRNA phage Gerhypos.1_27]|uniref:Maturation protein n=2 Tax=Leviviricetes TaxID=2842243 RepID=A0A8S5L2Y6_9VIRU|nr:maturation protein [ssRNA phage Gerhypos.1_27]QDH91477.1 MAG: hypothetical protein H1Bulk29482_000003 [Leviviridae sp.]DAD51780.1 TPA_asm: maturation protein [ssRNA phage Gerhypos.1_27]
MPARERSVVTTRKGGTTGRFVSSPDLSEGSDVFHSASSCSDITGPGDNAPFHVHVEEWSGGIITKPYVGFFSSYFNNYVADICRGSVIDHLGTDSPSNSYCATQGAARTNPSRPSIDIPVEAGQLAEIVSVLRYRGAGIIRQLAGSNLELQFGILPVVEDLDKLMRLSHFIEARIPELQRLRSNRGLRRTIGIGSYSAVDRPNLFIQSQNLLLRQVFDVSTTETIKVHTRWMPDGSYDHLAGDPALRALATLAVTGATLDASTAWELMPWSWLIDYFGNIGDYFRSSRNIVGATLSDVSVMRHAVTTALTQPIVGSDFFFEGCRSFKSDKRRDTSFVSMSANLNFLSENQVGIVASIAATR